MINFRQQYLMIILGAILFLGIAVWFFSYSPFSNIRRVNQAISNKEIVLNAESDIKKYFVFLDDKEIDRLLEKNKEGKTLFPQIELKVVNPIVIKEELGNIEGEDVVAISFQGLEMGTNIKNGYDSLIAGGLMTDFAWFTERPQKEDVIRTTYISASPQIGGLSAPIGETYKEFKGGSKMATLNVSKNMTNLFKAQIVFLARDLSNKEYLGLSKMLRKNGRFVMRLENN